MSEGFPSKAAEVLPLSIVMCCKKKTSTNISISCSFLELSLLFWENSLAKFLFQLQRAAFEANLEVYCPDTVLEAWTKLWSLNTRVEKSNLLKINSNHLLNVTFVLRKMVFVVLVEFTLLTWCVAQWICYMFSLPCFCKRALFIYVFIYIWHMYLYTYDPFIYSLCRLKQTLFSIVYVFLLFLLVVWFFFF